MALQLLVSFQIFHKYSKLKLTEFDVLITLTVCLNEPCNTNVYFIIIIIYSDIINSLVLT